MRPEAQFANGLWQPSTTHTGIVGITNDRYYLPNGWHINVIHGDYFGKPDKFIFQVIGSDNGAIVLPVFSYPSEWIDHREVQELISKAAQEPPL